jgi:hypothetical protein
MTVSIIGFFYNIYIKILPTVAEGKQGDKKYKAKKNISLWYYRGKNGGL